MSKIDINCPVLGTVDKTAEVFGLSKWYIRQGLKAGTIPHIRCGRKILINIPQLRAELDEQTKRSLVNL